MYKGYISVDFDATIAEYIRPWSYNKLGKPYQEMIDLINEFHKEGYHINIFTGRLENPKLFRWLKKYGVKYDTINESPKIHPNASRFKPYMNLGIDDKYINPMNLDGSRKGYKQLKKEAIAILKLSKE